MLEALGMGARAGSQVRTTRAGGSEARRRPRAAWALPGACLALAGCADGAGAPVAPEASDAPLTTAVHAADARPSDRCVNVATQAAATLGFPITLPNGTTGIGGNWMPITLGGISGEMASVLVSEEIAGRRQQGARHWVLEHAFRTPSGDYFITRDRAVCAPAGANPATCRVNDVLTIVAGTGIFADATGVLRNHGTIDFAAGTLGVALRGRVCGDGL